MDGHAIVVVPFHPDRPATEDEWQILPVHQSSERAAGWSPDGRLLYVLLERDGFRCLYAVQVDLASGAFRGDPFPVHHFHDAHLRSGSTGFGSAVVQGLFLSNHQVLSGNIWMTALQRNK
jgi:hypothetical protein